MRLKHKQLYHYIKSWKAENSLRDTDVCAPASRAVNADTLISHHHETAHFILCQSNNVLRFLRDPDFVPAFPSAVSAGEAVPVSYTRVAEPGPEASLNML